MRVLSEFIERKSGPSMGVVIGIPLFVVIINSENIHNFAIAI